MGRVFRAFRDDETLRVAILRAEGDKFFCPGWDLKAAAGGMQVVKTRGFGCCVAGNANIAMRSA